MNTKQETILAAFAVIGAGARLIAGHVYYVKVQVYVPLRTAAADLALLAAGFAALHGDVKALII
ncbi:hypothetical protein [Pseudorhodoferax sp.]|uniref:hypothetical protein n=1 Tax=Pseudorhodoferax sp. TaxID=1993553 RepID=UPI002DD64AEA|nr:hypothetical protein [Pseudorhodoferax sp.]